MMEQPSIEAEIKTNEKFEVIKSTLSSRMDIHQAKTLTIQAEMKAKMNILQDRMEAAIHSIRSEL
jgi:hypothetical protein